MAMGTGSYERKAFTIMRGALIKASFMTVLKPWTSSARS